MPVVKAKGSLAPPVNVPTSPNLRVADKLMNPGRYEVTSDSLFVINVYLKKRSDKWWVVCSDRESEIVEKVTFRMWNYDEMVELRKMATTYDQIRRVHMIDHDLLNRLKIQRLMVEWTFSKDNPRLMLHHVNGVLTDESWKAVSKLQPNILRFLMEAMNDHYEFGG